MIGDQGKSEGRNWGKVLVRKLGEGCGTLAIMRLAVVPASFSGAGGKLHGVNVGQFSIHRRCHFLF